MADNVITLHFGGLAKLRRSGGKIKRVKFEPEIKYYKKHQRKVYNQIVEAVRAIPNLLVVDEEES